MKKILAILVMVMTLIAIDATAKVKIPLKQITDTKTEYVVFSYGMSSNLNTARDIAQNECYSQLARGINSRVKTAIKTYASNYQILARKKIAIDDNAVTERITTTISNARISEIRVLETKIEEKRVNGVKMYVYWVSMAMPKSKVADVAVESVRRSNIDEGTKAAILNDRAKFEKSVVNEFEEN